MTGPASAPRLHLDVAGAAEVLDAFAELRGGSSRSTPGLAAARALGSGAVAWEPVRDRIVAAGRSVILAERLGGPVLAARWFAPGTPTPIHDHGHAGAALVVEGFDHYERFQRVDAGSARLVSVHDLARGDVVWWEDPPDDVHRQTGQGPGALELILLGGASEGAVELSEVGS